MIETDLIKLLKEKYPDMKPTQHRNIFIKH